MTLTVWILVQWLMQGTPLVPTTTATIVAADQCETLKAKALKTPNVMGAACVAASIPYKLQGQP